MEPVLYYYTSGTILNRILKQKAILPDRSEPQNSKEIPTVVLSSNPVWEKTKYRVGETSQGKLIMMNKKLLQTFDGGLYRITIPKEIGKMDWHTMKDICHLSGPCIKSIYNFSISVGARTSQWFGTTESIPEETWISIERLDDKDQWISMAQDDMPNPDNIVVDNSEIVKLSN